MNEMIKRQLEHRTIREFEPKQLPQEVLDTLLEVARRTASSTGMQATSVIRVMDPEKKKAIATVCNQEYIARMPELMIFIVDQYRNTEILKNKGVNPGESNDMDRFFSAFTDACLTAQNMVNAAESMDLGTVYLGSILNDSEKICEILGLPDLTFPVLGLGIGYPNQAPQLKPRMNMKLRVFEDTYEKKENYMEEIKEYDEEMKEYYDVRDMSRRVDSFSDQVVTRMTAVTPKRQEMLKIVAKQGFDLKA